MDPITTQAATQAGANQPQTANDALQARQAKEFMNTLQSLVFQQVWKVSTENQS